MSVRQQTTSSYYVLQEYFVYESQSVIEWLQCVPMVLTITVSSSSMYGVECIIIMFVIHTLNTICRSVDLDVLDTYLNHLFIGSFKSIGR